ncbi:MAG: DUF4158 domain-containing protein [Chloroflexi bacterium]|nr:DUF4158 domain-containing protein [Chloroflexota bacterium]
MLAFFRHEGRFPSTKHQVPAAVVAHLAKQVGVPAEAYVAYDWRGRAIKYHRAQIRAALGFCETTVQDAEQLVQWLVQAVLPHDWALDRIRAAAYDRCRDRHLEPPSPDRLDRLVRSALAKHEEQLCRRVHERLSAESVAALDGLLMPARPAATSKEPATLIELKTDPGPAGFESLLAEVAKLRQLRALGLPSDLFAGVAPNTRQAYHQRVQVEEPCELRRHPAPVRATLLGAWATLRSGELTDNRSRRSSRPLSGSTPLPSIGCSRSCWRTSAVLRARPACCSASPRPRSSGPTASCVTSSSPPSAASTCCTSWSRNTRQLGLATAASCIRRCAAPSTGR